MNNKVSQRTLKLVLAGVMIALATVLSFVKVFELPQGGAITLCSMLPIMFFSYKFGIKWGLAAGFTHSVLQLLFGLNALRGITGGAMVGSILLDYILAFTVLGVAGIFRGRIKHDGLAFALGAFLGGLLRYFCSFLSGWILWGAYADANFSPMLAGMSGNTLACFYSLFYNGSYMIPEIILTTAVGFLLVQLAGKHILSSKDLQAA